MSAAQSRLRIAGDHVELIRAQTNNSSSGWSILGSSVGRGAFDFAYPDSGGLRRTLVRSPSLSLQPSGRSRDQ